MENKTLIFTPEEYAVLFANFVNGNIDPDVWADYTIAFGKFWMQVMAAKEGLI